MSDFLKAMNQTQKPKIQEVQQVKSPEVVKREERTKAQESNKGNCLNRGPETSTIKKMDCVCMNPNAVQRNNAPPGKPEEWYCALPPKK